MKINVDGRNGEEINGRVNAVSIVSDKISSTFKIKNNNCSLTLSRRWTVTESRPPEVVCEINIKSKIPKIKPLVFRKRNDYFELDVPVQVTQTRYVFSIEENEKVFLSCSGTTFKDRDLEDESSVNAKCIGDDTFQISRDEFSPAELGCKKKVNANIVNTFDKCAQDGIILDIGFDIKIKKNLYRKTLIEMCFNKENSATYWAEHVLQGNGLGATLNDESRPQFHVGDDSLYSYSPDYFYHKKTQSRTLTDLLQSKSLADDILSKTFLARGHLAPDADFLFGDTQDATYFFTNAAPQWQNFNAGSWLGVEKAVRHLAKRTLLDYIIVTGTSGVLEIPDVNNNYNEMYLYGNNNSHKKLPVPKFYWKIMYEPESKRGIVFVGYNNYEHSNNVKWPCTDIRGNTSWGTKTWSGSIICCSVPDFQSNIDTYSPLTVNGLLDDTSKFQYDS